MFIQSRIARNTFPTQLVYVLRSKQITKIYSTDLNGEQTWIYFCVDASNSPPMPSISARMLLISASLPVMSVLIPPISALMLCIAVPMRLVSAQTPLGSVPMHAIATLMVMRLVSELAAFISALGCFLFFRRCLLFLCLCRRWRLFLR